MVEEGKCKEDEDHPVAAYVEGIKDLSLTTRKIAKSKVFEPEI